MCFKVCIEVIDTDKIMWYIQVSILNNTLYNLVILYLSIVETNFF